MASEIQCPRCARPNGRGTRFCTACGASLEEQAQCPSCHELQPSGHQFCQRCGTPMQDGVPVGGPASGAVVEGVWQRGDGEFIRRVDPEDTRSFLGNRVVRVPPGTYGVVLVDGVVERVLPPGERTTVNLFERIADFFTRRERRTAFYLVDGRPIPVPFAVPTRPTGGGTAVETQVLASFSLARGDKEGIGRFIDGILGDRPAFAAGDLYNRLRPDVVRVSSAVLERLASQGPLRHADAEGEIRRAITEQIAARVGLTVDVTVSPLTATASLDFHLGTGVAPRLRHCSKCKAELPAALRFCDHCGAEQPAMTTPLRQCSKCGDNVPDGDGFCNSCGAKFVAPPASAAPLFSSDGEQVEIDLVVRVEGRQDGFDPSLLAPALVSEAASHLRRVSLAQLATATGFGELEAAIAGGAASALEAHGMRLTGVSVVDVRAKTGQWLLGARADLERTKAQNAVGREWLAAREGDLQLDALTREQALRRLQVERDATLAQLEVELSVEERGRALRAQDGISRARAELAERRARTGIAAEGAGLDVEDAQRDAQRTIGIAAAQRGVKEDQRGDELAAMQHDMRKEDLAFDHEADVTRRAMQLDAEKRRQQSTLDSERARQLADDATYATRSAGDAAFDDHARRTRLDDEMKAKEDARQLDKMRVMAELERGITESEQAHALRMREMLKGMSEREMVAMQATELAKSEGGAAFANALGNEAHAREMKELLSSQLDRMERLATGAMQAATGKAEAAGEVYGRSLDAMSRVASSRAQPAPVVPTVAAAAATRPCPHCNAPVRVDAKFCGGCGKSLA